MDLSDIFNGRKILITGDTGFKGSWLALWLYKLGATVIGVGLEPKTTGTIIVSADLNLL